MRQRRIGLVVLFTFVLLILTRSSLRVCSEGGKCVKPLSRRDFSPSGGSWTNRSTAPRPSWLEWLWVSPESPEGSYLFQDPQLVKKLLSSRWIHFCGDSTTRQISQLLVDIALQAARQVPWTDVVPKDFESAKESYRACSKDEQRQHRVQYVPPHDDQSQCQGNEASCFFSFTAAEHGLDMTISFDWKHFIFEDYDGYVFGHKLARRAPDLIIVGAGTHDCFHKHTEGNRSLQMEDMDRFFHLVNRLERAPFLWIGPNFHRGGHPPEDPLGDECAQCTVDISARAQEIISAAPQSVQAPMFSISRTEVTRDTPACLWDAPRLRLHYAAPVQAAVLNQVMMIFQKLWG